MVLINKLSHLEEYRVFIDRLFSKYGRIHFHNYFGIEAGLIQNKAKDFFVLIDIDNSIVTAFERKSSNIWQCFFNGFPFLAKKNIDPNKIESFLQKVKSNLEASTLYFPLVYGADSALSLFSNNNLFYIYERLPSPIIKPPFNQRVVWKRVKKRYGSRADRQKAKFEKDLYIRSFTKIDVKEKMSRVELNSWKRLYKQDMLSRDNQIEFYNHLVKTGLAEIVFAYDRMDLPIAFRIDAKINKILYVLKWSYDDNFKKYSPGFYLLTVDLFKIHQNAKYKHIDLFGSPDSLKALVETNELGRVDIIFSDNPEEADQISKERIAYDAKIRNNYKNHHSIQKLFELD